MWSAISYCVHSLSQNNLAVCGHDDHTERLHFDGKQHIPNHKDSDSYRQHVHPVCRKANVELWSPNQLRHFVGTLLQTELSQEDARCVLGHSTASITARYAELLERAVWEMAKLHRKKDGEG